MESYHLGRGMRSTGDIIISIRRFSVLMLVRLLIRMIGLGMLSSSY